MFGTPISLRLVICVLAPIGIIYVTILIITRRISSSIEQSEARLTDAIARSEARLAASIEKVEVE